jgi:hypothetical protein
MKTTTSRDPLEHTANIKDEFIKLSEHLREDVDKVDDPKAKALFEVSAEVIDGLQKAFNDYEKKNESAWKK